MTKNHQPNTKASSQMVASLQNAAEQMRGAQSPNQLEVIKQLQQSSQPHMFSQPGSALLRDNSHRAPSPLLPNQKKSMADLSLQNDNSQLQKLMALSQIERQLPQMQKSQFTSTSMPNGNQIQQLQQNQVGMQPGLMIQTHPFPMTVQSNSGSNPKSEMNSPGLQQFRLQKHDNTGSGGVHNNNRSVLVNLGSPDLQNVTGPA